MEKNKKEKTVKGQKTVASTLGYCKYCGTFFQIPAGEQDPGHCGREKCIQKAVDINRIETPTTSGVTIVEFTGNGSKKSTPSKMKVGDNMYIMDVRKEHVYSTQELEELENEKQKEAKKSRKKTGTTKKAETKSKKTDTKKVSKK